MVTALKEGEAAKIVESPTGLFMKIIMEKMERMQKETINRMDNTIQASEQQYH